MKYVALFVAVALAPVAALSAADVTFNLDIGPSGQDVDPGDVAITGPGSGTNGTNLPPTIFIMPGTGDAVTVTIDRMATNGVNVGGIDWRDRGNSANSGDPLVNLGEDFIKNNGGVIRITFDGLPAGTYDLTSYHRDTDFTQSNAIDIFVSTDGGAFLDTGADGSAGGGAFPVGSLTTAQVLDGAAMFSFFTDGTGPVAIVFDGRASADDETPLSGLTIAFTAVPEPASLAVWCMGLACAAIYFGWRRRQGRLQPCRVESLA